MPIVLGFLLASLASASRPVQSQDFCFEGNRSFVGVGGSQSALSADLDGDGDVDIASLSDKITLLINDGDGTFAQPIVGATNPDLTGFAAADYDGDGDIDFAVADANFGFEIGAVIMFWNQGDASFVTGPNYAWGANQWSIAAADLNGDGYPDLAVTGNTVGVGDHWLYILTNNGDGTFSGPTSYDPGGNIMEIVAANFDSDSDIDVAIRGGTGVTVLKNDGSGAFGTAVNWATGIGVGWLTAADLDNDGDNDLACNNLSSVLVVRNNSDGTFAAGVNYPAGTSPGDMEPVDLDGDGLVEIVTTDSPSSMALVLPNLGGAVFGPASAYRVGAGPSTVASGDLDADGNNDIAVANGGSTDVTVLLNQGTGVFNAPSYNMGPIVQTLAIIPADLDRDGDVDLSLMGSGPVILRNDGSGQFGTPETYAAGNLLKGLATDDLDGDGDRDLISIDDFYLLRWWNDGAGNFGSPTGLSGGGQYISTGDLDSDGDVDVVVSGSSGGQRVYKNDGAGALTSAGFYVSTIPSSPALGDLDGDGDLDLAYGSSSSNNISVRMNNGDGSFGSENLYGAIYRPTFVTASDLDGDHFPELVSSGSGVRATVFSNLGDGTFAPPVHYPFHGSPGRIAVADIDGDCDRDIIAEPSGKPVVGAILNDGVGGFGPPFYYSGVPVGSLASTDVDGNGTRDLVTGGSSRIYTLMSCAPAPACPYPGDPDGSGLIDAVDLAIAIDIIFFGAPEIQDPLCPNPRADFDNSGLSDAVDLAFMIDHVFFGGQGPGDPCS